MKNKHLGPKFGHAVSAETRAKISASLIGNTPWNQGVPMSAAQKRKISRTKKGRPSSRKGIVMSAEQKAKLSIIKTGVPIHSEAYKRRLRREMTGNQRGFVKGGVSPMRGRRHSAETKLKISASKKGQPSPRKGIVMSDEQKLKLSIAHTGKKHSPEHCAAISKANTNNPNVIAACAQRKFPFNDTKPELVVAKCLMGLGLNFERQFWLKGVAHSFDFALIEHRLLVEVDGCYWHACPKHCPDSKHGLKQRERDQRFEREAQDFGWKVIRLWQHEITDDVKERYAA